MKLKMFDDKINLELFYQMKDMILTITTEEVPQRFYSSLLGFQKTDKAMTDIYEFKYPGEVLERHSEKGLNKVQDIRALALALAECKQMLESTMFVTSQYIDFINEIKAISDNDVYLLSALFILADKNEQEDLLLSIRKLEISDISTVFILMDMLSDDGYCWNTCGSSIATLFEKHAINVYENSDIIDWIHRMYYEDIKSDRSISMRIMKILMQFFSSNIKFDSKEYKYLITRGYSESEIHYLNMELSKCYNMNSQTPKVRTLQTIMINGLRFFISLEDIEDEHILEICDICFQNQSRLVRTYNGTIQLNSAIGDLSINSVEMFVTLYKNCKSVCCSSWFKFNIIDSKWDRLYTLLGPDTFKQLFINSIRCFEFGDIKDSIIKYNDLTNSDFVVEFITSKSNNEPKFLEAFIKNDLLDIKGLIDECHKLEGNNCSKTYHLASYLYHCDDVDNFDSWKYIIDKYGLNELSKLSGYSSVLSKIMGVDMNYISYNAWKSMNDIKEEHRLEVFYWVCLEVYQNNINRLPDIVHNFISSKYSDIIPQEDLYAIVNVMLNMGSLNEGAKRYLAMNKASENVRQKFQTDLEKKNKEREEERKQKEIDSYKEQIEDSLAEAEDDNDKFNIITELFGDYRYSYKKDYYAMCLQHLDNFIDNIEVSDEQAGELVSKMTRGLEKDLISFSEFKSYLERIKVA